MLSLCDDRILYREIKSKRDCKVLQADLDALASWKKKLGMEYHPDKCNILSHSKVPK